jgi:hypothetical protein
MAGNLTAGVFTITHGQNLAPPYPVAVSIFDNNGRKVIPDSVVGSANSVAINLSSFGSIPGTWAYVYQLFFDPVPTPDPNIGSFTNYDLAAGILTVNHYEGLEPPYPIHISIFNNLGNLVEPDHIIGSENSVAIDLTSFAPIAGTWGWVYI